MKFVIPMAGESRRFRGAGYGEHKYRLKVNGATLFDHAVGSFSAYFGTDAFLFVVRDDGAVRFVRDRCGALAIRRAEIVALDHPTRGQAETVLLGLDRSGVTDDESMVVFNIDTFRPGYRKPPAVTDDSVDGYLEVFRGGGSNWSFVAPDPTRPGRVAETAEKQPISDLCCTGLYHFRRAGDYRWAYHHPAAARSPAEHRERYVAPLYNALIAVGRTIAFERIDDSEVVFCGTPEEYERVLAANDNGGRA